MNAINSQAQTYQLSEVFANSPSISDTADFIVYRVVNKTNGKSYIGSSAKGLIHRFVKSCGSSHSYRMRSGYKGEFYTALREEGVDNFMVEILKECASIQEANALEGLFIEQYDSYFNGYNGTKHGKFAAGYGGNLGVPMSESARANISAGKLRAEASKREAKKALAV